MLRVWAYKASILTKLLLHDTLSLVSENTMYSENQLSLELINKLTGFKSVPTDLEIVDAKPLYGLPPEDGVDIAMLLQIKGEPERGVMIVTLTENREILRDKMRQIKEYAQKTNELPFIGGRYFGEGDRNLAMMEGVNLFDLSGNMYLKTKTLHYEKIVANNPFAQKPLIKDVFAPVSSRIIRVLLINPTKQWALYSLAKESEVSLGLAYRVVERLLDEKIVERDNTKKLILKDPARLLNDWREVNNPKKLQHFRYYSYKNHEATILNTIHSVATQGNFTYALGFFAGAALIAPFIRGRTRVEFYIENPLDLPTWERLLDMQKVEGGSNVDIYIPYDRGVFYGMQQKRFREGEETTLNVVSTVQLYVDLYKDPARGEEQAEHLRRVVLKY